MKKRRGLRQLSSLLRFRPIVLKTTHRSVIIFRKRNHRITTSLSTHCKTYCFAFQKRLFCTVKA
ncbi:hypothetical protein CLI70_08865 [Prevotella intermedia]|nr:hypothetical protein CLI70_08865 [Prevotella intermedia]